MNLRRDTDSQNYLFCCTVVIFLVHFYLRVNSERSARNIQSTLLLALVRTLSKCWLLKFHLAAQSHWFSCLHDICDPSHVPRHSSIKYEVKVGGMIRFVFKLPFQTCWLFKVAVLCCLAFLCDPMILVALPRWLGYNPKMFRNMKVTMAQLTRSLM